MVVRHGFPWPVAPIAKSEIASFAAAFELYSGPVVAIGIGGVPVVAADAFLRALPRPSARVLAKAWNFDIPALAARVENFHTKTFNDPLELTTANIQTRVPSTGSQANISVGTEMRVFVGVLLVLFLSSCASTTGSGGVAGPAGT